MKNSLWNEKIHHETYRRGLRDGIRQAAAVAADYDRLSLHDYLVSECILWKLNVMKGKPHRNKAVRPGKSTVVWCCGEFDRAMEVYWKNIKRAPDNPTGAVFETLKSFERDRGLSRAR